jgi:site-specific recombinase XerD
MDIIPAGQGAITPASDVMQNLATFLRLNVAEGDASEHTIEGYLIHIRQFYEWCQSHSIPAGQATEEHLAYYRRHMVEQGYKRSTITVKLSAIRRFYQAAIWRGLRQDNPAEGLKAPRDHTTRRDQIMERYLSPEEVALLLDAPDRGTQAGIRDWAIIGFMYFHGLRVSEVSGLELSHVNLDAMQLQVKGGKGNKDRVTHLTETTAHMARSWLTVRREVFTKKSGSVFFLSFSRRNLGGPISVNGVRDQVNHYLGATGLKRPGVSCHALRHSHATHYVEAGGDLATLSGEMGHANIQTTGEYLHVANAVRDNPAKKLEETQRNLK